MHKILTAVLVVCGCWALCAEHYNVVVIGGGPAGSAAAIYTGRANLSTLLITGDTPYGQLAGSHEVENWPGILKKSGTEIMEDLHAQVGSFGVQFLYDAVTNVDFSKRPFTLSTREQGAFETDAVVIATGSSPKKLGVPGEDAFWGNGVSSCAVCDCFLFRDKDVVVVGGGDSAVEEAIQLVGYARSVTIVVRSATMRAAVHGQEKLRNYGDKIKIIYNSAITEIVGDAQQGVTGVVLFDAQTQRHVTMPIDGVFLAIGHIPNTELFKKWLTFDATGHILLADHSQATIIPGVFAAGDVADNRFKQAGKAAGDGIQAGMEAVDFVRFAQ